jgi:hypothetical protein
MASLSIYVLHDVSYLYLFSVLVHEVDWCYSFGWVVDFWTVFFGMVQWVNDAMVNG